MRGMERCDFTRGKSTIIIQILLWQISHLISVLLVGEAVHLGADLLDRGFDLLAVDEDGHPAGA